MNTPVIKSLQEMGNETVTFPPRSKATSWSPEAPNYLGRLTMGREGVFQRSWQTITLFLKCTLCLPIEAGAAHVTVRRGWVSHPERAEEVCPHPKITHSLKEPQEASKEFPKLTRTHFRTCWENDKNSSWHTIFQKAVVGLGLGEEFCKQQNCILSIDRTYFINFP